MKKPSLTLACFVFVMLTANIVFAGNVKVVMSVEEAVAEALKISPEIMEAQAMIDFRQAQINEAQSSFFPQIDTMAIFGPAPSARGDHLSSPDTGKSTNLSFFTKIDSILIQPLYTFGKISNRKDAAEYGKKSESAVVKLKASEVRLRVKEYYYGLMLAIEGKALIKSLQEQLAGARRMTKKLLKQEDPSIDESALYRIDAAIGKLAHMRAEVESGYELAKLALAAITGNAGKNFVPADKYLLPVKNNLEGLAGYTDLAMNRRPELEQLKSGLKAMDSLLEAAKADLYPNIFAAGFFSYAWAPDRTDIENPFINDEFNHLYGGVGLGVQWHLDFGIGKSKIAQTAAEKMKYKAKEQYANINLPLEVAKYFKAIMQAGGQMKASKKGYEASRRWMVIASSNYDLGVGPLKELTDASESYALQKAAYFKAVYDYNLAWARLEKAIGTPVQEIN